MHNSLRTLVLTVALAALGAAAARANLLVNGSFESGFTGWTRADQTGSEGTFELQTGTASPVNSIPVPAPPDGATAAMTDAMGPGSHVLYQDFVVPAIVSGAMLSFELFLNNAAPDYWVPDSLNFATPALNQQARVDLVTVTADPFSVAAGDVLLNLYATAPGDPLTSGYTTILRDVTALLAARPGETLRLRFAAVDNVFTLNMGVDTVSLEPNAVPEPATLGGAAAALALGLLCRRRFV